MLGTKWFIVYTRFELILNAVIIPFITKTRSYGIGVLSLKTYML